MIKHCGICKKWKFRTEFHKNKSHKDGLSSTCKLCAIEKSHTWYHENQDKALEANRKWQIANIEKVRDIQHRWRENNPERNYEIRDKALRKYRENNVEKVRAVSRNWKKNNVEKNLQINRNYRALKNGNGGEITIQEWQWLKEFYDFSCLKCGRKEPEIKLTLDHVKPLKLGGKNVIQNAQPLCGSCNSSKGAKEIDYRDQAKEVGVWG